MDIERDRVPDAEQVLDLGGGARKGLIRGRGGKDDEIDVGRRKSGLLQRLAGRFGGEGGGSGGGGEYGGRSGGGGGNRDFGGAPSGGGGAAKKPAYGGDFSDDLDDDVPF